MNMPRFTADLCLRNADRRYQVSALEHRWRVSVFCLPGWEVEALAPAPTSETNVWRVEESGKCGIITESGEGVAWDEAWESPSARE